MEPLGDVNLFDLKLGQHIIKAKTLPNFRLRIGDDVCLQPDHAKNAPVRCPDGARRLLMLEFPILLVGLIFYIVVSQL